MTLSNDIRLAFYKQVGGGGLVECERPERFGAKPFFILRGKLALPLVSGFCEDEKPAFFAYLGSYAAPRFACGKQACIAHLTEIRICYPEQSEEHRSVYPCLGI